MSRQAVQDGPGKGNSRPWRAQVRPGDEKARSVSDDQPLRVAVVGGGITGLAAAYHLVRQAKQDGLPLEITLFEKEPDLGGKVRSHRVDGLLLEGGPDSFLTAKPWMRSLCESAGLGDRLVPFGSGATGTYMKVDGRLRLIPPGLGFGVSARWGPVLRSDLLSWRGKLRLFMEPFIPPFTAGEETIAAFARRRLGHEAATRLMEPMMAGIFGGEPEGLSLDACFPAWREMERRYGSLTRAMRASSSRGRNPRAGGGPGGSSSGSSARSPFLTVRDGLQEVVNVLRREMGSSVRLVTQQPVVRLKRDREKDGYLLTLADGTVYPASGVILTVPAFAAASILEEACPAASRLLRQIRYSSAASVYLAYRREDVPHPLDGTGYMVARDGRRDRPVSACTWVSSKWPHCSTPDRVLIRCHMGVHKGVDPAQRSPEQLVEEARAELREVMGIQAPPRLTQVFVWPTALPQYELGHRQRVDAIQQALGQLPGVAVAGAAYRGVGLPDCVRQGQEAATAVAEWLALGSRRVEAFRTRT